MMVKAKRATKKKTAKRPAKKATKKKSHNRTEKGEVEKREVLYPKPEGFLRGPDNPITAEFAKELLGWELEGEEKFGDNFLLKDENGRKICCHNNTTNRPLVPMIYRTLKQEHLRQRWRLNGETIILGQTGLILDGQHTLIGLILAQQERDNNPEKWPDCPKILTMERFISAGISEDDEVVNTINTGKPRSLADVFYRGGYFIDLKKVDRNIMSKIAEYAVKLLWDRTGAKQDAFDLRRTHAESLDFVSRHPKLLDCVEHVFQESVGKEGKSIISPGYLAAMLYLMASSDSSPEKYFGIQDPTEETLNWNHWNKAYTFIVLLLADNEDLRPVKLAILRKKEEDGISLAESLGVLCLAWDFYLNSKPITDSNLKLRYSEDAEGVSHLLGNPTVGGIDLGSVKDAYTPEAQITPEEVEKRKAEVNTKRTAKKKGVKK